MPKRRFSTIRRDDEESTPTAGEDPGTSSNGSSANGAVHRGSDPPNQVQATSPEDPRAGFFDREADTNEFAMPDLAAPRSEPEPDEFKPEGIVVSGPAAPPEEGTANAPATAPPEHGQEPTKRVTKHEWQVDDGSDDDSDAFVPASGPAASEPPDVERERAPETKHVQTRPPGPPAAAAASVPTTDTNEGIRDAELAAVQAVEQQAFEEITALEEDLERAKREGEARVEELEAKLTEAEDRASEAEERGTVAPGAAQALEEEARNGAANWLRAQVRKIERNADQRVKAAAEDGGDREKLDSEHKAETERRLRQEADQRVRAETADLRRELDAEREDKTRIIEGAERRLQEIEQRALAATDRVTAAERELADEADRLRADAEERIEAESEKARIAATKAAGERVEREVAAAFATFETEARETLRSREQELIRERAAIEGELAAMRRRFDEAHERAVAAERRAAEIEIESRREIERERESRFQEIEGRIGQVAERAGGADVAPAAVESDAGEISPPEWVMEAPPEPAVEPESEPDTGPEVEAAPAPDGMLSLSSASFDELRETGMSVTQAKRVIRHRDEHGGFRTVDALDQVPGFPKSFLADVKSRVVP